MRKPRKLTLSRETILRFDTAGRQVCGGLTLPCVTSAQIQCPLSHNCPPTFGCPPPLTAKC